MAQTAASAKSGGSSASTGSGAAGGKGGSGGTTGVPGGKSSQRRGYRRGETSIKRRVVQMKEITEGEYQNLKMTSRIAVGMFSFATGLLFLTVEQILSGNLNKDAETSWQVVIPLLFMSIVLYLFGCWAYRVNRKIADIIEAESGDD